MIAIKAVQAGVGAAAGWRPVPPRTRRMVDDRVGGEYWWQQQIQGKNRHKSRRGRLIPSGQRPIERETGAQVDHRGLGSPVMAPPAQELLVRAVRTSVAGRTSGSGDG